jgi:hypothetical protein
MEMEKVEKRKISFLIPISKTDWRIRDFMKMCEKNWKLYESKQ